MHRAYLINESRNSTRDELSNEDRLVGDTFFEKFGLEYGGHSIVENKFKKAATWLVPDDQVSAVAQYIATTPIEGYSAQMKVLVTFGATELSTLPLS
jgi:hypothetical protein